MLISDKVSTIIKAYQDTLLNDPSSTALKKIVNDYLNRTPTAIDSDRRTTRKFNRSLKWLGRDDHEDYQEIVKDLLNPLYLQISKAINVSLQADEELSNMSSTVEQGLSNFISALCSTNEVLQPLHYDSKTLLEFATKSKEVFVSYSLTPIDPSTAAVDSNQLMI